MLSDVAALASGPFLAACLLLGAAGCLKIVRPSSTRSAAHALRLPSNGVAVRVLGVVEVSLAIIGATFGAIGAALVGVMFAALAVVAAQLRRRAPDTPCGCLGVSDAPASLGHIVVNACASAAALLAAFGPRPISVIADQPLGGVPFLTLVVTAAVLASLVVDALPALRAGGTPSVPPRGL